MTHPIPSPNSGELVGRLRSCRVKAASGPDWLKDATPELLDEAATLIEHLEHEKAELQRDREKAWDYYRVVHQELLGCRDALAQAQAELNAAASEKAELLRQLEVARETLTKIREDYAEELAPFYIELLDQALSNISGQG